MNVCKVPVMCKDMEYKLVTEDSKTRVYLSLVREFNEAEYEKYYLCKKRKKLRRRILFVARTMKYVLPVLVSAVLYKVLSQRLYLERGSNEIGSEVFLVAVVGFGIYCILSWFVGGDKN